MPVNKIGGSSIWIRRRQAARPRDLRSGGCKDWRQMFHERGAEAAGSDEETRRIAANIAEAAEGVAPNLIRVNSDVRYWRQSGHYSDTP
jgi:hypothetical protein